MKKSFVSITILVSLLLFSVMAQGATLKGSVYNAQLEVTANVLVEINTQPMQKFLAKDGSYQFNVPPGEYVLTARKGTLEISETILIKEEGEFIYDLFLLPDFTDEDKLWQETEEKFFPEEEKTAAWRYWAVGIIIVLLLWRFAKVRRKYGSLRKFKKKMKQEHRKTLEQHKAEIAQEPGYLEEVLTTIEKQGGRITQKKLRREMLHLSESKISLILTELEHKGKIAKIKKGRGNVIVIKNIVEDKSGA